MMRVPSLVRVMVNVGRMTTVRMKSTDLICLEQDATLTQCLQMFIEPEVLGPDDKWYCPHCKEHIQAEKKMSIWRLPPILIIHLKRFKYNQYVSSFSNYQSHTKEKIETNVKFPIQ